jgi:hypothetical protein
MSSICNSGQGRLLGPVLKDAVSIINFVLALARRRSLPLRLRHGTLHHHHSPPLPSSQPSSITSRSFPSRTCPLCSDASHFLPPPYCWSLDCGCHASTR